MKKSTASVVPRKSYVKHGESSCGKVTKEYGAWRKMRGRCYNPNDPKFSRYGGRGIRVCDRWLKFANFLCDMGRAPSAKYSINRKDNDGNYEPRNCEWSTDKQQSNNRSTNKVVTYLGRSQTLIQWARELNMNFGTLCSRIGELGFSIEQTFTKRCGPFKEKWRPSKSSAGYTETPTPQSAAEP